MVMGLIGMKNIKTKTKTMKTRYFWKSSDEELFIGDRVELDLSKELENGHTLHTHMDCKFIPELIPILLEKDLIRVEEGDKEEDIEEDALEETLAIIIDNQDTLEHRVEELEKTVEELGTTIKKLLLHK